MPLLLVLLLLLPLLMLVLLLLLYQPTNIANRLTFISIILYSHNFINCSDGIKVTNAQLGPRVRVNASNGSLIIASVQPKLDEANYECALVSQQPNSNDLSQKSSPSSSANPEVAAESNEGEKVLKSHGFKLDLLVAPRLSPFEFPSDAQIGMKLVITCSILKGQQPISFVWLKDNQIISGQPSALPSSNSNSHQQSPGPTTAVKSLAQVHSQQLAEKLQLEAASRHPLAKQQLNYAVLSGGSDSGTHHNQQQQQQLGLNMDPSDSQQSHKLLAVLSDPNIRVRQADDYSILSIDSLELKHSGRYTCSAQNEAARATYNAQLVING